MTFGSNCIEPDTGRYAKPRTYRWIRVDGKDMYAHRYAYEQTHGPIPEGMKVCHECDNPSCVNPRHLFLGTNKDNSQDMAKKRRVRGGARAGSLHHNARLTADDVSEIRSALEAGTKAADLARKYGVSPSNISHIKRGTNWTKDKT